MKNIAVFVLLNLVAIACSRKEITKEIVIEGDVKNIPNGKIYLTEAHYWQVHLDSTQIENGHFVFRLKPDSSFVPYQASLYFTDSSRAFKVAPVFFRNYMKGKDSTKYRHAAFILERGYTRIEGDNHAKPASRVFAGKETDLMYKFDGGFGWIDNTDSVRRVETLNYYKRQIKIYPFSYFMLKEIYQAKEQYTETELSEILSLFNSNVQDSKLGDEIRTYLQNRPDPNTPYPNLSLINAENIRGSLIDTSSKLNMIVFWASWCGPCRLEIPSLKEIYHQYKGKGLNMVSVSIDQDKANWETALKKEKMHWPQYVVDSGKIELLKQQFNFSAIPYVIFTDKKGVEIKNFVGYDKEQKKHYEDLINQFIFIK